MRGGLSTRDHDYGIFNNIHHDIGTHVVHHLFPQVRIREFIVVVVDCLRVPDVRRLVRCKMPYCCVAVLHTRLTTTLVHQMPHYHIVEATEAVKPVLGEYFVEPEKSGPIPFHLIKRFFKGTEVGTLVAGDPFADSDFVRNPSSADVLSV